MEKTLVEYSRQDDKVVLAAEGSQSPKNNIAQTSIVSCHRRPVTVHYDSPRIP